MSPPQDGEKRVKCTPLSCPSWLRAPPRLNSATTSEVNHLHSKSPNKWGGRRIPTMSERARKKDGMDGDGKEMGWRKKRRERLPPLLPPQFPILAGFRLRSLSAKPFLQSAVLLQSLPLPHLAPSISASDQSRILLLPSLHHNQHASISARGPTKQKIN